MQTTTHPERRAEEREAAARADLNAEAEHVMNNSRPTPTQEEMDAIVSGKPAPPKGPDNPEMPPLHEQRAMIAEARDEGPGYRTRQMRARRAAPLSDDAYPQHRDLADRIERADAARAEPVRADAESEAKRDELDRQHGTRAGGETAAARKP